ncbi:hypothetical protein BH23THE1_BH23THE1_32940 [soil metagenome]
MSETDKLLIASHADSNFLDTVRNAFILLVAAIAIAELNPRFMPYAPFGLAIVLILLIIAVLQYWRSPSSQLIWVSLAIVLSIIFVGYLLNESLCP